MDRYVLVQNIRRYQELLSREGDEGQRQVVARLLLQAERELAILSADRDGVDIPAHGTLMAKVPDSLQRYLERFRDELLRSERLLLVIAPEAGLPILEASEAYATATMSRRDNLIGRRLFEAFPDNPADPSADGVANLYASLRTAAGTAHPHRMTVQKYDVRNRDGVFEERYWQPVNSPVLDSERHLIALLHEVTDVTGAVKSKA